MAVFQDIRNLLVPSEIAGTHVYKDARLIDLQLIKITPNQPRSTMNKASLEELTQSIEDIGLMQPIVVRQEENFFRIVAGHRRFEAWKSLTDDPIPCIVRQADEIQAMEQSLIENIQREKLNEVDEARCYRILMDQIGYTIEKLAQQLHKSVGYIDSRLKLLRHNDIAQAVTDGSIGIFEARELAKVDNDNARASLLDKVIQKKLDRDSLKQEVRKAIGKDIQQLKISQMETLKTKLGKLKLSGFDEVTKQHARGILLEIQGILTDLLNRY